MKKFFLCLTASFVFFSAYSQLKVKNNGKIIAGNEGTLWTDSAATLSVYGDGLNGAYGKVSFGPFLKNQFGYWGTYVGEWNSSPYGQNRLWLHGSKGIYLTTGYGKDDGATGDSNILIYYDTNVPEPAMFIMKRTRVWGEVYAQQFLSTSDVRLKTNIQSIGSPLNSLMQLEGVTYNWSESGTATNSVSDAATSDSSMRQDKLLSGFLAQDFEKIFPHLVDSDANGYKSIDYIGLIPYIIEAMKEQQDIIAEQGRKIDELQSAQISDSSVPSLQNQSRQALITGLSETTKLTNSALLYQNTPNPFNHITEIGYYLPQATTSAMIHVFTMQGALLKSFPLNSLGEGVLQIQSSEFRPGMYIYSLIVDGREIDSKRMIITD